MEKALPNTLQNFVEYDYYLFYLHELTPAPFQILRSDFRNIAIQQSLQYLTTENYVADPIYRLLKANERLQGVVEMCQLVRQADGLPENINWDLPHLEVAPDEEMGWRSSGWPRQHHEICILAPLNDGRLAVVSLFICGEEQEQHRSKENLKLVFPTLAAIIELHFRSLTRTRSLDPDSVDDHAYSFIEDNDTSTRDVQAFFKAKYHTDLTKREARVFASILQGRTPAYIAESLSISIDAVRTHRRNVYRKIGKGRAQELICQFHMFLSRNGRSA